MPKARAFATGRIEIAFKHLKSGTGLDRPPAETAAMAKAYVLAHLLLILLTEPLIADHLGDSPRVMRNACQACGEAA